MSKVADMVAILGNKFFERVLFKKQIEKLYLIMGGAIFFETLSAAVEFDLFSLLSEKPGLTATQIADHLQIDHKPTRILLLGCTALGLLKKSKQSYRNTRLAEIALSRKSPRNILAVVRWQHHINYKPMHSFYDAIKANANVGIKEFDGVEPYLYGRLTHHPELEQIFQDAMEDISIQSNVQLTRFVDFAPYKYLVDVGGGNATNIIALAKKYPQLSAAVFDSPSVCDIARKNIDKAGMQARLGAVAGDCFSDEFPDGVDCLLFCHFFTIWSEERNRWLLKKCFESLPSGGTAIIFNMMQNDNEDGPLSAAMGSPYFLTLATGEGMLYTWQEYEAWMRDAGFKEVKKQVLIRDHGVIIGIK
ncbi:MAG: acetylserotonin O-methyltransferase [Chromatiaceae bacterium]|nr:acetylserotonin O-methyltransferase [Chromatiaceae bacterium]